MNKQWMRCSLFGLLVTVTLGCSIGCSRGKRRGSAAPPDVLVVSKEQHASWVRNFNPLLAPNSVRWPATAGIYEPLYVYNTMTGEYVPWLATQHEWSDGNKKLTFRIRPGVEWSDGTPLRARDVAFTFGLLRAHKALDIQSVWGFLDAVGAKDDTTVEFSLTRPYVPGLFYITKQPIVPEHKWKDIADPVTYANPDPVATGPFTKVKVFQNQVYELERNPRYWQKGKPSIRALRFPAYPGNDQANLALITGEVDWAGNFLPDIDRIFLGRDRENHHYWFPLVGGTVILYPNTTRKPFDDVRVRRAISMAIDRAQIVRVAMYNYTRPIDATGLSDAYARWRNPKAMEAGDWVTYRPDRAEQLLDEAGCKRGGNGMRVLPDGTPMRYHVNVVTGWSDWVRASQIIAQSLTKVGIDATLKAYDFGAFFDQLQKGEFDLSMGWSVDGPAPYSFYRELMATQTVRPVGEPAASNWHRYGSKEADALLNAFEATADPAEQRRLSDDMQLLFVESAPVIPLFPNPSWGEYNTSRITGFPSKENPYAKLSPNDPADYLLVLTELKPK
jgi:peptide/nickel transport system substrate-binding protein